MQIMSVLELMEALDRKEKEEIVIAKSASPGGKKRKVEDAVDSSELIARVRTLPLASLRREVGGSGGKNKMLIKALGAMDTRSTSPPPFRLPRPALQSVRYLARATSKPAFLLFSHLLGTLDIHDNSAAWAMAFFSRRSSTNERISRTPSAAWYVYSVSEACVY